jgi:hypothetical protein
MGDEMTATAMVDLGFTATRVPAGTHICQIFNDADERNDSLLRFLASGLAAGESGACFSNTAIDVSLGAFLDSQGLSLAEAKQRGALSLSGASEVYFAGGTFDPTRMLGLLSDFHDRSLRAGFGNARVIGEMTAEIDRIPGGSRLLEYEARVSMLLRDHPITTVCQYDARAFGGSTIMDVLKVHPMMVVRGSVVHNPYFVPPEDCLS